MAPIHLGDTGNIRELSLSGAQNSRWTLNGPFFLSFTRCQSWRWRRCSRTRWWTTRSLSAGRWTWSAAAATRSTPTVSRKTEKCPKNLFWKVSASFSNRPKVDSIFFNPIKFWENTWMKEIWEARPQQLRRQGEKKTIRSLTLRGSEIVTWDGT